MIIHTGDLFDADGALAHCVSKDLKMSAGIAVEFKRRFGRPDKTKNVGEILITETGHYYLITKNRYFHKPTYASLRLCLQKMCDHAIENGVEKISMPRIGCGLDRLDWDMVADIIEEIFDDSGVEIHVYFRLVRS